ncbi:glycerophosphodiester phosphodiesterase [Patulibacter sp. S7RM1-6]
MSGGAVWPGVAARRQGRTLRTGHMGCHAVVPGNTIASLERAAQLGVDVVEFDALPDDAGALRLAHDPLDLAARPDAPTLEAALDRLAAPDMAGLGINLDAKAVGREERIAAAVRERGLQDRVLVSTMEVATLGRLRRLAPEIRLGWSVPRVTRDWWSSRARRPAALAYLVAARRALPPRLVRALTAGRIDAVMAHWSLITPAFARAILPHGELHAWTVDDPARAVALRALGVTGVTSNDPRLLRW